MANHDTNNPDLTRAEILWKSADTLRGQIDAAEYKHVVLGLPFLKYIADAFDARRDELKADYVLANPPFDISDWFGKLLADAVHWRYGPPPVGTANHAWLPPIDSTDGQRSL